MTMTTEICFVLYWAYFEKGNNANYSYLYFVVLIFCLQHNSGKQDIFIHNIFYCHCFVVNNIKSIESRILM